MYKIYQTRFLAVLAFILIGCVQALAQQLPQINYQGVARKADGSPLAEQSIRLRLSIRDGGATGTSVYSETRQQTTNKFGLFTVVIGSTGTVSQTGTMAAVNWSTGNKFLQVELDPSGGNSFVDMGTSQLQSVPYAIYAGSAAPGGAAGGDLSGTYPNPTVSKLQGAEVSNAAPNISQVLKWNGTAWAPSDEEGAVGTLTANLPIIAATVGRNSSVSIAEANATTDGYLSKADWLIFNGKATVTYVNEAISANSNALATEATRAMAAEGVLTTGLGAEITRATTAEGTLAASVATKEAVLNKSTDVSADAASDEKYPSVKSIKTYVDTQITSATPDATTTALGRIQLGGDLAGTGTTALVPIISNNAITTAKLADANITTAKIADANITTDKLADNAVTTAKIADANITAVKIADANVTTDKLADNAVTTSKITDGNITTAKIASGGNDQVLTTGTDGSVAWIAKTALSPVGSALATANILVGNTSGTAAAVAVSGDVTLSDAGAFTIVDNAVTTAKLADANITTAKIADANITTDKLADNAVTTAKIADANVTTTKIADANVTTDKLAENAVTTSKIADANVTTAKIASGGNDQVLTTGTDGSVAWVAKTALSPVGSALATANILVGNTSGTAAAVAVSGDVTLSDAGAFTIVDNAVTTAKIADANITTAKIADANITTDKLAENAVTTLKIADGNITTAKIADANITTDKLADNAVTTSKITDANITTAKIADANITTDKLAENAVTTSKIADANVTTAKIASGGNDQVLTTGADGSVAWVAKTTLSPVGSALTAANILVGNSSGTAAAVAVSGDVTLSDAGAFTIVENAVTTSKITDANITTAKIAEANVTTDKLADNAVTTAKITDGNITTAKLADNAVTTAKVTDASITTAKIASTGNDQVLTTGTDGSVAWVAKTALSPVGSALATANILVGNTSGTAAAVAVSGDVTLSDAGAFTIVDNAVTTSKILNANITTEKIAALNVTTGKLADNAVTTDKILSANVTTDKIAALNVTTGKLADNAVTTDKILSANVTTDKIAALNVTTGKLADNAVTTDKILDANITTAKITDASITTAKIASTGNDQVLTTGTDGSVAWVAKTALSPVGSALTAANILVGNSLGTAAAVAVSGDVTLSDAGAFTIVDDAVTTPKITDANITTAKIADANITTDKLAENAVTTSKITDANITTAKIADNAIINSKIADLTITDAKLAPISAAGKVSNSATTATYGNFANTIVSRDNDGSFKATTVTADLIGDVTGTATSAKNVTGIVAGENGGTGVENQNRKITLGSDLTIASGGITASSVTLTSTAATNVTLPVTGTLATLAGNETLLNKTLSAPIISTISNDGKTLTLPTTTGTLALTTSDITGNAATVTTNADLTGVITSVGNETSVASQTGTGSKFVMDTSPTLVTPVLGVATATSVNGTTIPTSKTLVVTTDKLSALAPTTSEEISGVISDETGTGSIVLSASPTFTGTPTLPTGTIGVTQLAGDETTALATTQFVTTAINTATPEATATVIGKIQLAGDLAGSGSTAEAPVISNNAITTGKIVDGTITKDDISATAGILGTQLATEAAIVSSQITSLDESKIDGPVAGARGGTGVDNTGKTITLGGNLVTSGAFETTLTSTAATNVTLPIGGTLATLAGTETLTNKTLVTPDLGTPSAGVATNLTGTASGLTAGKVITNANLTGEVTSIGNAATLTNSAVIGKVLTGYTSGAGTIAATDNILQAIQKLDGNNTLTSAAAVTGLDGLTDAKVGGTSFSNSLLIGHQTTGTLSSADRNIGIGIGSISNITTGDDNIAIGYQALNANTTSNENIAIGRQAMSDNSSGSSNTAIGLRALSANSSGHHNAAYGYLSMVNNLSGSQNAAFGQEAMQGNDTGNKNVSIGGETLYNNSQGSYNIAIGFGAAGSNTTGTNNTIVGYVADVSSGALTNATALGNGAVVNASNKIQLGNTSVTLVNTSGAITSGGAVTGTSFKIPLGTSSQFLKADGSVDNSAYLTTAASTTALASKANLESPTFTGTVSGITKAMVGLGSVDNTTDAAKPVSTATQTALNLKADLAGASFSGAVSAPSFTGTTFTGALTGNATTATTAGTVTTAAQPNITSVGTLTGLTAGPTTLSSTLSVTGASTLTGNTAVSGSLNGGNTETSSIAGFSANIIDKTTNYTLTAADNGKIITFNSTSDINLTVPTLYKGFNCMVVQTGDGKVTFVASGTTISNRSLNTKTAGKNAIATLIALNGTTFISSGDMEL